MTDKQLAALQEMGDDFNWTSDLTAVGQRIKLRTLVFKGQVPFNFDLGLSDYLFKYKPILIVSEVKLAMASLGIVSDIKFQDGRVFVVDLNLQI